MQVQRFVDISYYSWNWEVEKGTKWRNCHPLLFLEIKKQSAAHLQKYVQLMWICICVYKRTEHFILSSRATPRKCSNLSQDAAHHPPSFPPCFFFCSVCLREAVEGRNTSDLSSLTHLIYVFLGSPCPHQHVPAVTDDSMTALSQTDTTNQYILNIRVQHEACKQTVLWLLISTILLNSAQINKVNL